MLFLKRTAPLSSRLFQQGFSTSNLTHIPVIDANIIYQHNPKSRALRAVIITENKKKYQEFYAQLGDGYGMELHQYVPEKTDHPEKNMAVICEKIMKNMPFSPHFILHEKTTLTSIDRNEDLTLLPLETLAQRELETVIHGSRLHVYKPQWQGEAEKTLSGFTAKYFEKRIHGYIKPHSDYNGCEFGFGWDGLFVNSATNLSHEEFYDKYGKKSARQHAASVFIESYLRYKTLSSMRHHSIPSKNPVDFGHDYIHLTEFVQQEAHLSNPYVHQWGIEKLRNATINEGLFFKAAWSRPVKNYFSPPFSGIPLTAKKDSAEETIFMMHDMLHHLIPDLICDQGTDKKHFNVYSAWRMISEACTLVLADMLYADSLIQNGIARTCVDQRIYPLFEAIKVAQDLSAPENMSNQEQIAFIHQLLFANVRYALLGDDSEWRKLLTDKAGQMLPEHLNRLNAYTAHFEKFFIGDHAWTRANFDNMNKHTDRLHKWIHSVGKPAFTQSNIPLLSDTCTTLEARKINMNDYKEVVDAVFALIFETRLKPHLQQNQIQFSPDHIIQSRAFRRFLIGQSSLFSRYPVPFNLDHIPQAIFTCIQSDENLTPARQNHFRMLQKQYIHGIEGLRLMSRDEALNAIDCATVFPPVYIAYPAMLEQYGSIVNCVSQCIESYKKSPVNIPNHHLTRVINGITFIDAIALEQAIGKDIPAKDRLRQKMMRVGVEFWDAEKTIIKKPIAGISTLGSFSVSLEGIIPDGMIKLRMGETTLGPFTPQTLADGLKITMGLQSTHTYMNPNAKHPRDLYENTIHHQHFSITHAATIGIHVFGLSKKAELEFDVQRDKLHLARHTSARHASQDEPCLVAMTERGAQKAKEIRELLLQQLQQFEKHDNVLDWREERNALFPLSATVSLGINGTLRNFMKVIDDLSADGKELEYRNILAIINDSLSGLFPELFKLTTQHHHTYPAAWTNKPVSILTSSFYKPNETRFNPRETSPCKPSF